jgi:uncharacterized protein YcfL
MKVLSAFVLIVSLALAGCKSKEEEAREAALESQAEAMEAQAKAAEKSGEAQAEALKNEAERTREKK